MTGATAGVIGALVGLLIAILANLFVLPIVIRSQQNTFSGGRKVSVLGWDPEKLGRVTQLAYRFVMPVVFAIVGAVAGAEMLGTQQ